MSKKSKIIGLILGAVVITTVVTFQNCAKISFKDPSGNAYSLSRLTCTPGDSANCPVSHGTGTMVCLASGHGWALCGPPVTCERGYMWDGMGCQDRRKPTEEMAQVCNPGAEVDCGMETTEGKGICNAQGTGISSCVLGDCKPGFTKGDGETCVHEDAEELTN